MPTVTEQTSFFWEKSTTTQGLVSSTQQLSLAKTSMYFTVYHNGGLVLHIRSTQGLMSLLRTKPNIGLFSVFASDDNVWFTSYLLIHRVAMITWGLLCEPLNGSQSLFSEEVLLPECSLDRHCDGFFCSSQMLLITNSLWGMQNKPPVWLVKDLKIMEHIKLNG